MDLQVVSKPTQMPDLAPTVAKSPLGVQQTLKVAPVQQPTLAPKVASAPANIPAFNPQVQQAPAGMPQIASYGTSTSQTPFTPRLSMQEFAQKIKQQYPEYADRPDETLAQAMLAKYPEYMSKVFMTDEPKKEQSIYSDKSKFGRWDVKSFLTPAKDVAVGFGKSLAKVGQTILKPVDKALGFENGLSSEDLSPKGVIQSIGKFAGDVAYGGAIAGAAAPVVSSITASANALKAPAAIQRFAGIAGRSVLDAGLAYGTMELQGSSDHDAKTGALIAGSLPWVSAAFSLVGRAVGLKNVGTKIQTALIKPTKADLAGGFKIENVNKYHLGGNLEQTAEKTQAAITERAKKLKSLLKPGSAEVDLNKVYYETTKRLENAALENAGSNLALKAQLDKFAQEMTDLSKNGIIDIADAQTIKRAFGAKGAWQYGIPVEDANAIEQVYNTAYNILKTDIETAAARVGNVGVKQINKELGELIPIEHALIRRLPVAARQNPISLTDLVSAIGGTKLGLSLFVLNRLSKNGRVGAKLAGLGTRPESRGTLGTLISGPGEKQLQSASKLSELNIPEVNFGLSVKSINPSLDELGKKINQLNELMVNAKNQTLYNRYKKAYDQAIQTYKQIQSTR